MYVWDPLHLYFVQKGKKTPQQARKMDLKWWFVARQERGRDVPAQGWSMCCRWEGGLGQTRLCLMLEEFTLCREGKSLWLTSIMLDQRRKEEWFQGIVWDIFLAIPSVSLLSFLWYASLEDLRAWLGVQEGFIVVHKEYLKSKFKKVLFNPRGFSRGQGL